MSPNGMQFARVVRSQLVFRPYICCTRGSTICTQGAVAGFDNSATPIDGLTPEGRKKFVSAAGTYGPPAPTPQPLTVNGLSVGAAAPAATAASRFLTIRSPRTVFALIGRLRCLPPL